MSSKLEKLRQKLLDKDTRTQSAAADNAIYKFWDIPYSTDTDIKPAIVRYLPDGDEENDYFWAEVQKIRLKFPGVKGQSQTKEVEVQVPCVEMWDGENSGTCPILSYTRPWFKETPDKAALAKQYWKKRSYIFQCFVRQSPLKETDLPENPIRRVSVNTTLYKMIRAGIFDPEMDEIPTDYVGGTDFKIIKTRQGNYASYDTSGYLRKSTPLTEAELNAIETYGLKKLSDFLPKKPGDVELKIIKEMFLASLDGEPYDLDRWGKHYKPFGLSANSSSSTTDIDETDVPILDETEIREELETPITKSAPASSDASVKKTPRDVLAEIKARAEAAKAH